MKEQIEKQAIAEMARVMMKHCEIENQCGSCHWSTCNECFAEALYNAGYRKQKDGEWIKVINHIECSECHYRAPYKKIKAGYHLQDLTRFCPNCGAKMKGGEQCKSIAIFR